MTTRIKLRRDTAANWTANNPILAAGEPGLETDTRKTKYGNGTTHWADLEYSNAGIEARDAVGAFFMHGPVPNYTEPNGADWWFESVTTDPDGNAYFVGGDKEYDNDTGRIHIVKVNPTTKEIEWAQEYSWPEAYEGYGTSAIYNTATDQLTVVGTVLLSNPGPGNEDTDFVMNVNPATGAIVGNVTTLRDEVISDGSSYGWINSTDVALLANGDPVVVGSKQGNLQTINLTTTTGCTTNVLFVVNNFPEGSYPVPYWDWYITGTNIANEINLVGVNEYYSMPTNVLTGGTGTGVTFTISADGAGGYTIDGINGGTGYKVWNKIKILGSNLGGADGTNDAFVTIVTVSGDAPATANISGTSVGSSQYSSVSGVNVPSGSGGFVLNTAWRMKGADVYYPNYANKYGFWLANGGDYYAEGDTVYVNPQDYGGLTSATITVTSVSGNGTVLDFSIAPVTQNTATVKLITSNSVDFSVAGNWQALHRDEQFYIWTPAWSRLVGDTAWDRAQAVATDSAGNIYVSGRTYDPSYNSGHDRGLLIKVTSAGNLVWSKTFEPSDYNDWNDGWTGVVVDHDDNVIVCADNLVTKVDSDGVVLWQRYIGYGEPFDMWNACVDVDADNNIYVAGEIDYMGNGNNDNFGIFKFNSAGVLQWAREAGTAQDEDTQWNNGYQVLAIGGTNFYLAGSSYQGNDDVAFGVTMTTDGANTGTIGKFFYQSIDFVSVSTSTGTAQTMAIYFTATDLTVGTTSTFVATTSTVDNMVRTLRTGNEKGRINDLYSITFEDGTEQTTAYRPGLSESIDSPKIYNTDNYNLNRDDAGKMIRWVAEDWTWGNSVSIYVPSDDIMYFDVGTQFHFMKDKGIKSFMFWDNNGMDTVTIIPAQPADGMYGDMYNSGEGWSVHHPNWDQVPCIATITKIAANRWLLSCNSSVHVMDWSW